jgi:hypothetical protein
MKTREIVSIYSTLIEILNALCAHFMFHVRSASQVSLDRDSEKAESLGVRPVAHLRFPQFPSFMSLFIVRALSVRRISARGMRHIDLGEPHTQPSPFRAFAQCHFRGSERRSRRDHRLINQGNLSAQY